MSTNLSELKDLGGFIAAVVDSESGLMIVSETSSTKFDIEAAGAEHQSLVRAKNAAMKARASPPM